MKETQPLPGILLNTIPKSGSVYMFKAFETGLNIEFVRLEGGLFPFLSVSGHQLLRFVQGNTVCHAHLSPKMPQNLLFLDHYVDKMVVHVRDPRMCALEYVHHWITQYREREKNKGFEMESFLEVFMARPDYLPEDYYSVYPEGFYEMSFQEQVGACIDTILPVLIEWIEGWVDISEHKAFKEKILFTEYKNLVKNEEKFFEDILDFYGIDRSLFTHKPFDPPSPEDPAVEGEYHFRNKRLDEWRDVFTNEQLEKACSMMPKKLLDRFSWPEN